MILTVRPMTPADVAAAGALDRDNPGGWDAGAYQDQCRRSCGWQMVAETDGRLAGVAAGTLVAGEAEIHRLAVAPFLRHRGIGRRMLAAVLARLVAAGAAACFLEVRPSNLAARRLYHGAGFGEYGRRPHYYRDPDEDALCLARVFAPSFRLPSSSQETQHPPR